MQSRIILTLLALLGWGAFTWAIKRTVTPPVVETKEVERVVTKVVVKEVTKPDGTVTKETTSFQAQDKAKTLQEPVKAPLSRWSLGVSTGITPDRLFPLNPIYGVQVGHRIMDSPLWIQTSIQTNRELTLGLYTEW
jgi:hypothetical protein